MDIVQVCDPSTRQPFESFVENTTTVICLPEGQNWQLYFKVAEPGRLTIESDGEKLFSRAIEPSDHFVDLKKEMAQVPPAQPFLAALRRTPLSVLPGMLARRHSPGKLHEFTVVLTSGGGEPSSVAATFDFKLVPPAEYRQAYASHCAESQEGAQGFLPHKLIVDWQADDGRRQCWNCHEPLDDNARQCPRCQSDQQQEEARL